MPRFNTRDMTDEDLETLVQWVRDEGLVPGDIADDGRFSVHNGRVSGNKFLRYRGVVLRFTQHFNVPQKNPLPEALA